MKAIILNLSAWVMLPIMDGFAKHLSFTLPILQITWARYFFTVVFTLPIMFFFFNKNNKKQTKQKQTKKQQNINTKQNVFILRFRGCGCGAVPVRLQRSPGDVPAPPTRRQTTPRGAPRNR